MNEFFDVLNENGEYINKVANRDECHKKGLWHKAVVLFIISNDNQKVLLQLRSATKKLWPNLWDITAGGHVLSKELGYQAVIRETKEEIGINIKKEDLLFIGSTRSVNIEGEIINKHFNEFYVVHKDINIENITLEKEEVENIKWFNKEDIIKRVKNNYDGITDKQGCWQYLLKYFELTSK